MSNKTLYWICQGIGWGLYMFFSIAMMLLFSDGSDWTNGSIILQVILLTSLVIFSHGYRNYIKRNEWSLLPIKQLIPRVLLGVIITSLAAQIFVHVMIYFVVPLDGILPFSWPSFFGYTFSVALVFSLWSTIYFAYQLNKQNRKNEMEKLALTAALNEAELAILKNQINPHFLFNALNNIRALVLSDPEKARTMVTHISELLRYSIQFNASEKVSLEQEIEIVKDYLQLESIQFDDRLTYSLDIDNAALGIKIPPMAIQLLVENAIKHGISQLSTGGEIYIQAKLENDHLHLSVTNDGQLKKKSKREGVGIKNLVERLKILFGQFAELSLVNSSDKKVTASLKIPLN